MGDDAFQSCAGAASVRFSGSLPEIPHRMCFDCSSLKPVKKIGAFSGYNALTEPVHPDAHQMHRW